MKFIIIIIITAIIFGLINFYGCSKEYIYNRIICWIAFYTKNKNKKKIILVEWQSMIPNLNH